MVISPKLMYLEPAKVMASLKIHVNLLFQNKILHQGANKERATGSGITTDEDVTFSVVPVDGLAVVELVDKEVFEHLASFSEIFNVGKVFNIFLEFSLHHQSILANELDTIILVRVVRSGDLDT